MRHVLTGTGREESRKSIDLGQPDLPQDDITDEVSSIPGNSPWQKGVPSLPVYSDLQLTTPTPTGFVVILNFCDKICFIWPTSVSFWPSECEYGGKKGFSSFCLFQRVISKDGNILSKAPSGMQSGGEEEQDEEAHTPLPPPMEIIKDPSAQDEKVARGH